jgi:hypothetical protein
MFMILREKTTNIVIHHHQSSIIIMSGEDTKKRPASKWRPTNRAAANEREPRGKK